MHDVLAHRISLLSLHAGALEYRPDAPPAEIEATAGVVREAAAAALEELRDVIGVLREGRGEARPPQPTLAELPALIEESRAAGDADRGGAGPARRRVRLVGRTAYRIVQEGLTNARKHAPGVAGQGAGRDREEAIEDRDAQPGAAESGAAAGPARSGQRADRAGRAGRAGGR